MYIFSQEKIKSEEKRRPILSYEHGRSVNKIYWVVNGPIETCVEVHNNAYCHCYWNSI